jgi:hypothetical protein
MALGHAAHHILTIQVETQITQATFTFKAAAALLTKRLRRPGQLRGRGGGAPRRTSLARAVIKTSDLLASPPRRYNSHALPGAAVNEQELMTLRQRAMRAAEAYGCHAGIEVADFLDSADDPPGSLHLKIVVARRSASGELLSHESNVLLVTDDYGASVEQIVRQAAAELAER